MTIRCGDSTSRISYQSESNVTFVLKLEIGVRVIGRTIAGANLSGGVTGMQSGKVTHHLVVLGILLISSPGPIRIVSVLAIHRKLGIGIRAVRTYVTMGSSRILLALDKATAEEFLPYPEDILLASKNGEYRDAKGGEAQIRNDRCPIEDGNNGEGESSEDEKAKQNNTNSKLNIHPAT